MRITVRAAVCSFVLFFLVAVEANGQGFQGGIRGAVRDPGGVVPGADVTLINEGTNVSRIADRPLMRTLARPEKLECARPAAQFRVARYGKGTAVPRASGPHVLTDCGDDLALTEATVDDATMAIELIKAVDGRVASITGDAAYDAIAFYDAAGARGATVVVPPAKTARVSRRTPRSSAPRSHDSEGAGGRTTTVEKGVWLPSPGPCGERLLPIQVDQSGGTMGWIIAGPLRFMHQRRWTARG